MILSANDAGAKNKTVKKTKSINFFIGYSPSLSSFSTHAQPCTNPAFFSCIFHSSGNDTIEITENLTPWKRPPVVDILIQVVAVAAALKS